MRRIRPAIAGLAMLVNTGLLAAEPRALAHRVWLLGGLPDEGTISALRTAGVKGVVLPVGRVEVSESTSRFTLAPLPDLKPLTGVTVTALVWIDGKAKATGDPAVFAAQFGPVQRSLPGGGGLILAARQYFPGLPEFAAAVSRRTSTPVELALSAAELRQHLPVGGWARVRLVAVVFGDSAAAGFAASTLQDDLQALEGLDALAQPYRAAIVVAPVANPAPGPAGASLACVTSGEIATFKPGERGDIFLLHQPVDWGGLRLEANQSIAVEVVDTARLNRDLGLLLRPLRPNLEGWDTVGLPAPEPALGMSREAFLEYLQGVPPYPVPEAEVAWPTPTVMRVALANPTAQASALATTGNWVELRFSGTVVRDVQLGEFSGLEYGRLEENTWRRAVVRDATALRLFLTYVPPRSRVKGAEVSFLTRPREVMARWGLRLGDGSDLTGPLQPMALAATPRR